MTHASEVSPVRAITVRPARRGERDTARPLAEAFEHDPVMASFVPAPEDRRRRLDELFWAMINSGPLQGGTVDVAVDERGTIVGTAVWEAPRTGRARLRPFVEQIPRYLRALGLPGAVAAVRHRTVLQRPRPVLPHWYLAEIGVASDARGLGVGSSLLAHRLELIDAAGGAAYLESSTESNRALYRRFAFVDMGSITGLPSGRPMAMWRPRGSDDD